MEYISGGGYEKMADAEKNNMKEYICKSRSLPRQLKEI